MAVDMNQPLQHDSLATNHQVCLESERLLLRAFEIGDAEEIHQAVSESWSELSRWLPWCRADYSMSDTLDFIHRRAVAFRDEFEHAFAIVERSTGRLAGATGINQIDQRVRRANLGYWLRTEMTGMGYATEAAKMVAKWAFDDLKFERLEIVVATGNIQSQRVALRTGAVREGIARRRLRMGDEQRDAVVFSLVPNDFLKS